MGVSSKRKYTDQGMWDEFLKGMRPVQDLYNQAFATYMRDMEEYDALPVQARITRLTPVILQFMKSRAATQEEGAAAQGKETNAAQSAGSNRSNKRTADTSGMGQQTQRQKKDIGRKQGESFRTYEGVPTSQDYTTCPDAGYQSTTEAKTYNHSLRNALNSERRCLVCWAPDHNIHGCPNRSQAFREEMERQVPSSAMHHAQSKDTSDCTPSCHDGSGKDHGFDCADAGQASAAKVAAVGAEEDSGEAVGAAGDVEAVAEAMEQYRAAPQPVHSTYVYSSQEQRVPGTTAAMPCPTEKLPASSAPVGALNLNLIGTGKLRLRTAHYTFDTEELQRIGKETRGLTRDGFAHGAVHRNPACSTDACWLPEQPFQCCDHRGHHCWMDPPVNEIEMALQSYAAAKQQDPSNTSMCILVPVWRQASWWKRVKKFKRIRAYPKGAELLVSGVDTMAKIQLPYRAAVFYDPPSAPAVLEAAAGLQPGLQHHMVFETEINGEQARVLLDTGASQSFISKKFCQGVDMKSVAAPTPQQVKTAGGTEILAQTLCQISFQLQGMGVTGLPLIVLIPDDFTVLLGDNWLRSREAILNFADQTCSLKRNERGKRHILHVNKEKPGSKKRFRADLLLMVRAVEDVDDPTALDPQDFSKVPEEYRELLEKYKDVWPKDLPAGLPPLRAEVELVCPFDSKAIPVATYRMRYSPAEIEEARKQVKRFLEKGFIRPPTSPYGASVLFTPKKDGGVRMCIDYRKVIAQTRKDKHPLPRADELMYQLHGADTFSGLDLLSGYHQVRVHESDIPKTAFRTSEGLYEWLVMPFGLTNAPGIFQRVMNTVFRDYLGSFVNIFLDDIMAFTKEEREHLRHAKHKEALELVFLKMREHRLYGKLSKSFFGQSEIPWLGRILNKDGVRPDPAKTEVIADWPRPTNVKELQSFLGFANWFRQYMRGYSQHVSVLTKLTRKNQTYDWTLECEEAFLWVKQALADAPVLAHADFTSRSLSGQTPASMVLVQSCSKKIGLSPLKVQDSVQQRGTVPLESRSCSR